MGIFNKLNLLKEYKQSIKEKEDMLCLIDRAKEYLNTVSLGFDASTDEDLVDYYIYEKRAAELNYKYLLKKYSMMQPCPEKPCFFPKIQYGQLKDEA